MDNLVRVLSTRQVSEQGKAEYIQSKLKQLMLCVVPKGKVL